MIAGLVVELPFCSRPFCLPVVARLWRPGAEASKVDIAAALVKLLALWHREARIHVVADAAYHGPALRHLPARITVTTRLPANAVLYDLAPPPTSQARPQPWCPGTPGGGSSRSPSPRHASTFTQAKPAAAPATRSSAPHRSRCTATRS